MYASLCLSSTSTDNVFYLTLIHDDALLYLLVAISVLCSSPPPLPRPVHVDDVASDVLSVKASAIPEPRSRPNHSAFLLDRKGRERARDQAAVARSEARDEACYGDCTPAATGARQSVSVGRLVGEVTSGQVEKCVRPPSQPPSSSYHLRDLTTRSPFLHSAGSAHSILACPISGRLSPITYCLLGKWSAYRLRQLLQFSRVALAPPPQPPPSPPFALSRTRTAPQCCRTSTSTRSRQRQGRLP